MDNRGCDNICFLHRLHGILYGVGCCSRHNYLDISPSIYRILRPESFKKDSENNLVLASLSRRTDSVYVLADIYISVSQLSAGPFIPLRSQSDPNHRRIICPSHRRCVYGYLGCMDRIFLVPDPCESSNRFG